MTISTLIDVDRACRLMSAVSLTDPMVSTVNEARVSLSMESCCFVSFSADGVDRAMMRYFKKIL